jgi:hypothetical protein
MKRKTTIGSGVRRETTDPSVMDRVAMVRDHLGVGEDVRVEDLSPTAFWRKKMDEARDERLRAIEAMSEALSRLDEAWDKWSSAQDEWFKAKKEELDGKRS